MKTEEIKRDEFYDNLSKAGLIFGTFYNEFQKLPLEVQNKPFGEIKKHLKQNPGKYDFKIEKSLLPELKIKIKKLVEDGEVREGSLIFNLLWLAALYSKAFRGLLNKVISDYAKRKAIGYRILKKTTRNEIEGWIASYLHGELDKKNPEETIHYYLPPIILTRCEKVIGDKLKLKEK